LSAPLVLASGSPRRADLLAAAGIPFERGAPPDIDETPPPGLAPREVARALALAKARTAAARAPGRTVLAADTVVALGTELLGKPGTAAEALRMLGRLQGREHEVHTGVALVRGAAEACDVASARVRVDALGERARRDYVATGEPLDKAGGYALQGRAAAFVRVVEGAPDTVVGLPIALLRRLLAGLPPG
jgi:septum formation protein